MQGQHAKMVTPLQERAILGSLATPRYPARDQVMFLWSMKAGLRAKAMASLTWAMVTDAAGQVAEVLHVPNRASKGKTGGRTPTPPTHTQNSLCAPVQAAGRFARGFSLTWPLSHSILTLLSSSRMSWPTAATGVP